MVDLSRLMQDAAILEVIDKSADEASNLSAQNSYQAMRIEELEAKLAALQVKPDAAGLVAHLDSLVKHTKEVADSSQICDATAERYLINASYLQDTINALLSQAAQLQEKEAECEGLRRDAERWRFLRDEEYDEHLLNYLVAPKIHRDSVDAAIDSARKEST